MTMKIEQKECNRWTEEENKINGKRKGKEKKELSCTYVSANASLSQGVTLSLQ